MSKDVKKVVLAYSGGLDTSIILKWLQTTYRCEVITFTADLGQALLHYLIALRLFDSEVDIRSARYRAASLARNSPPHDVVNIGKQAAASLSGQLRRSDGAGPVVRFW